MRRGLRLVVGGRQKPERSFVMPPETEQEFLGGLARLEDPEDRQWVVNAVVEARRNYQEGAPSPRHQSEPVQAPADSNEEKMAAIAELIKYTRREAVLGIYTMALAESKIKSGIEQIRNYHKGRKL